MAENPSASWELFTWNGERFVHNDEHTLDDFNFVKMGVTLKEIDVHYAGQTTTVPAVVCGAYAAVPSAALLEAVEAPFRDKVERLRKHGPVEIVGDPNGMWVASIRNVVCNSETFFSIVSMLNELLDGDSLRES